MRRQPRQRSILIIRWPLLRSKAIPTQRSQNPIFIESHILAPSSLTATYLHHRHRGSLVRRLQVKAHDTTWIKARERLWKGLTQKYLDSYHEQKNFSPTNTGFSYQIQIISPKRGKVTFEIFSTGLFGKRVRFCIGVAVSPATEPEVAKDLNRISPVHEHARLRVLVRLISPTTSSRGPVISRRMYEQAYED